MIETRTFPTPTVGRYLLASAGPGAPLLVGFHGYGQNAETLLDALDRIPGSAGWTRASAQGLHRFYNSKTQEVVASWMTSQDREAGIEDNLAYVGRVVADLRAEFAPSRLVFAGFSQGAAMAWRAAARLGTCDGLLVLGGDIPKDILDLSDLALPPILMGRGNQDVWYPLEQFARDQEGLAARGILFEVCAFDGGHAWGPGFLEAAGAFLARLRP